MQQPEPSNNEPAASARPAEHNQEMLLQTISPVTVQTLREEMPASVRHVVERHARHLEQIRTKPTLTEQDKQQIAQLGNPSTPQETEAALWAYALQQYNGGAMPSEEDIVTSFSALSKRDQDAMRKFTNQVLQLAQAHLNDTGEGLAPSVLQSAMTVLQIVASIKPDPDFEILSRIAASTTPPAYATVGTREFDTAVREGMQALKEAWERKQDEEPRLRYRARNNFNVWFAEARGRAVPLEQAEAFLADAGDSTVATAKLLDHLYSQRRNNPRLCKDGRPGFTLDEILVMLNAPKHVNGGWHPYYVQRLIRDLAILNAVWVQGTQAHKKRGKDGRLLFDKEGMPRKGGGFLDGQYYLILFYSLPTPDGDKRTIGGFFEPVLAREHEELGLHYITEIDTRALQLDLKHQRDEFRLMCELTEEWRRRYNTRTYNKPYVMGDLLYNAVIRHTIKNHTRIAERIEEALAYLHQEGFIGEYGCLATGTLHGPVSNSREWLAAEWRILPPEHVLQRTRALLTNSNATRGRTASVVDAVPAGSDSPCNPTNK